MHILKGNVPIKIWTDPTGVDSEALDQLKRASTLPVVFKHIAVMPDVHAGKGCTVGTVLAMKDAVCPAAVGVDIGCGMMAVKTNLCADDLPDTLSAIRASIEEMVPVGFNAHSSPIALPGDTFKEYRSRFDSAFKDLTPHVWARKDKAILQLGTLGGGNHFIELCLDETNQLYILLHSGSRNIGKELAEYHIGEAQKLKHNEALADKDLAYFLANTPEMAAYRHDLYWAQEYAAMNRNAMMSLIQYALRRHFSGLKCTPIVSCHHNYVAEEIHFGEKVFVTRKGAIHAAQGVLGIIPGSMGASSYIVEGLGNPESFESASHGAGRRMSRGKAKKTFTEEDLKAQTKGIECRKDLGVLDEIPSAYKNIDEVMDNQKDLVKIKTRLSQILCVKG